MKKQAGIALFVCLMILLILSLLGISAMRMMTSQNLISSSSQGADIAFDAAETAINEAISSAQLAASDNGALPAVSPGVTKEYVMNADKKGITTSKIVVSALDDEMTDAARAAMLSAITDSGAFPGSIDAKGFRFSARSEVGALGIATTHVQDTIIFAMK